MDKERDKDSSKKNDIDNSKTFKEKNPEGVEVLTDAIETLVDHAKKKYNLSSDEVLNLLSKKLKISEEKIRNEIPVSIFKNDKLSCLEAIVKYLKENLNLKYHEIALSTNRDDRTIWATYDHAKKKLADKFIIDEIKHTIPLEIFQNRKFSVLELISKYLHEDVGLSYHEIAVLLNRNDRTIWTVYQRYKTKKEKK
ncbi:hypothetical protein J4443_04950 [Candidatus Woesearchaeota archaeon]|nr:hypothetical protein [Candidatus Woesearchaeota archaeon]